MTIRTISRLFDSHAEAARAAGALVAAGVPRVQLAIIGPYRDEVGFLRSPAVLFGAVAGAFVCLIAVANYGVSPLPVGMPAAALVGALCGGSAGGLFAAVTTAIRPNDLRTAEGVVLVTAHVDDGETDIARAVLGGCDPSPGCVAEAA